MKMRSYILSSAVIQFLSTTQPSTGQQTEKGNIRTLFKERITVEFRNTPLSKAISIIEGKTQVHFNYLINDLPNDHKVSGKYVNIPANNVLKSILDPVNLELRISDSGEVIIVKPPKKNTNAYDPKFTISGYITDASTGEALIGTNIYI